ncbi:hypothetical protein ACQW02_05395 [Humitalea sp. 24SJ18S-53]|uniref:hypothetical protein n=1 Tax=Humitalea sp. 24SJ18S-53 TaxID=3422307 RepID=UPI003D67DA2D
MRVQGELLHVPPSSPSLDRQVRTRLGQWPQRPPGSVPSAKQPGTWLRGRPDPSPVLQPFLKYPGGTHMRTLPDGLWLHFGPDPQEPYCDILCVEACSSMTNLLDKRSRFAPNTSSLLAVCPLAWLLAPSQPDDDVPRWRQIGLFRQEPVRNLSLPVRDIRVLYGLTPRHYRGFAANAMPHPHEYFCPIDALIDAKGEENPAMRALIERASASSSFMSLP